MVVTITNANKLTTKSLLHTGMLFTPTFTSSMLRTHYFIGWSNSRIWTTRHYFSTQGTNLLVVMPFCIGSTHFNILCTSLTSLGRFIIIISEYLHIALLVWFSFANVWNPFGHFWLSIQNIWNLHDRSDYHL